MVGHDRGIEYCLCALETKSVFILKFKFSSCEGNIKIKEDCLLRRILFVCLFFRANCFYLTGAWLLGLAKSKLQKTSRLTELKRKGILDRSIE